MGTPRMKQQPIDLHKSHLFYLKSTCSKLLELKRCKTVGLSTVLHVMNLYLTASTVILQAVLFTDYSLWPSPQLYCLIFIYSLAMNSFFRQVKKQSFVFADFHLTQSCITITDFLIQTHRSGSVLCVKITMATTHMLFIIGSCTPQYH